uniref:Uncharacterized protein n=1 Tax=Ditylenchus dipsaci TaxID=166011 RepID=A0A915EGU0_9BILA
MSMENIFKVVTDGGSNMVSAFKDVLSMEVSLEYLENEFGDADARQIDAEQDEYDSADLLLESSFQSDTSALLTIFN